MASKLSASKIAKIIEYKHAGYSQHQIALKLHINQSTVCHYWNEFDGAAKYAGIEAATQKFGGGDVSELNSFAAEMKKENVSIPELKEALAVWKVFQKLELGDDDYEGIIKACVKITEKSFLETAVELDQLETKFGDTGMDVITELEEAKKKLQETKTQLDELYLLVKNTNKELANLKQKTQVADKDFEAHMNSLGLTKHRLDLVEAISLALKKAGIPDEAIETYLKRQAFLDGMKLDISLFGSLVFEAKMVTATDGGQSLINSLKKYGGLTAANASLEIQKTTLKESVSGLQEQAKIKGKLEVEIASLESKKASLEPYLEKLQAAKDECALLRCEIVQQIELGSSNVVEISKSNQKIAELEKHIGELTEKTKDLSVKENRVIELDQRIAELEDEKKKREDEWLSLLGFVALVREQPLEGLVKFSEVLPLLLEGVKQGKYEAITLRNHAMKTLAGSEIELPMCCACVNNPDKIKPPKLIYVQAIPPSVKLIEGTGPSKDPAISA